LVGIKSSVVEINYWRDWYGRWSVQ